MSQRTFARPFLLFAWLLIASSASDAQILADSAVELHFAVDSAEIRRLPISRSAELPSFLPGTMLGLDYGPRFRSAIGQPDARLDGVPTRNLSLGSTMLFAPHHSLESVAVLLGGTPVALNHPMALLYRSAAGGPRWTGSAGAGTDAGLPGSIGNLRLNFAAGGPLGASVRVRGVVQAQSARGTEFNNVGGLEFFEAAGTDTVIAYRAPDGSPREITIPRFEPVDGDILPRTGWDEILAMARVDLARTAGGGAFAAVYAARLQELEYPGEQLFNLMSQRGNSERAVQVTLGLDRTLGANSAIAVRVARTAEQQTRGVLDAATTSDAVERGLGSFRTFGFLIDDDDFPVNDELISRIINNQHPIPFGSTRNDLRTRTAFRINPYGTIAGFSTAGVVSGTYDFLEESRLFGSAQWQQRARSHSITLGAEATSVDTRFVSTPYTSVTLNAWIEEPVLVAAYIEDLFELGPARVQVGVRYDSYDSNAEYSPIPGYVKPDSLIAAPASSAFSPRISISVPVSWVHLRANAGLAAQPPRLFEQFLGKNTDFFRFRNTNTTILFSRPAELVRQSYAHLSADLQVNRQFSLIFAAFRATTSNAPVVRRRPVEDPTNPGSTTFLNLNLNEGERVALGLDAVATYQFGTRNLVRGSVSRGTFEFSSSDPNVLILNRSAEQIAANGLVQLSGPRASGWQDTDLTIALRALRPEDRLSIADDALASDAAPWITRLDARIAKTFALGRMRAAAWAEGLRLVGSEVQWQPDQQIIRTRASAHMNTAGGGSPQELSLHSADLPTQHGIRNEVDLHLLRRAEARYGNGDLIFTLDEQRAAFSAAETLQLQMALPNSQDRRFLLGLTLSF